MPTTSAQPATTPIPVQLSAAASMPCIFATPVHAEGSGPRSRRRPLGLDKATETQRLDSRKGCNQKATSPSLAIKIERRKACTGGSCATIIQYEQRGNDDRNQAHIAFQGRHRSSLA